MTNGDINYNKLFSPFDPADLFGGERPQGSLFLQVPGRGPLIKSFFGGVRS
eukprot:COSAG06_NODE_65_length_26676_cov_11.671107_18_plen_51_part_00